MAGMYPADQTLSIFGEQVKWPGLDPATGKFTNGSFTDPPVKPSFIPAETVNLILDNLNELITALGGVPNNTDISQLKNAFFNRRPVGKVECWLVNLTVAEMIMYRQMPLNGQLILISQYQDLCTRKYCGDVANSTATEWYKCDGNGTRTTTGAYMRVQNVQGLFLRAAGSQIRTVTWTDSSGVPHSVDTLYDGGAIGAFIGDAIRNMNGNIGSVINNVTASGVFQGYGSSAVLVAGGGYGTSSIAMNTSVGGPTAAENRPGSISVSVYISY